MKRGDIYTAATGSGYGSKPRPVLILQSDAYCAAPNIIVALIGTARDEGRSIRPQITPTAENGLFERSEVMADIILTVPQRKFGQWIGVLSTEDQNRVDEDLLILLGLHSLA